MYMHGVESARKHLIVAHISSTVCHHLKQFEAKLCYRVASKRILLQIIPHTPAPPP